MLVGYMQCSLLLISIAVRCAFVVINFLQSVTLCLSRHFCFCLLRSCCDQKVQISLNLPCAISGSLLLDFDLWTKALVTRVWRVWAYPTNVDCFNQFPFPCTAWTTECSYLYAFVISKQIAGMLSACVTNQTLSSRGFLYISLFKYLRWGVKDVLFNPFCSLKTK